MQNPFIACGGLLGLAMAMGIDQFRDWSARRTAARVMRERAARNASEASEPAEPERRPEPDPDAAYKAYLARMSAARDTAKPPGLP